MSENTDTPITDDVWRKSFRHDHIAAEFIRDEMAKLELQLAQAISRAEFAEKMSAAHLGTLTQCNIQRHVAREELAEATAQYGRSIDEMMTERDEAIKQRDRLAGTLESIRRSASTKMSHSWIQRQAEQALASLERKEEG